jgi:DNA-binding MarR family transcriptional regulator
MAAEHAPSAPDRGQAPPSVAAAVARLGSEVGDALANRLAPLAVEPREFRLLRALAGAEGASQRALGTTLGIHPNRMVSLVDDLEGRSLVRRKSHPSDRRAHALTLTAKGTRLLDKASAAANSVETDLCAGLQPAERDRLLALLSRLRSADAEAPAAQPGVSS